MGRPRAYEIDAVLSQAMTVFWRRGFVATSMSDIYEATGLKPGNLYATFKDKDGLFRAAFEAYAAHFRATLPKDIDGRAAIVAWLNIQAQLATDDPERKGCLIINTVTEREAHSAQTRALAQSRLDEILAFFRANLAIAAREGEIPPGSDIDRLGDALVGAVVAIMSLARAGAVDSAVWHVAEQAIASLSGPAAEAPPRQKDFQSGTPPR